MHLKPSWGEYLAEYRRREFAMLFSLVPPGLFPNILELGAGHGHHAALLREYAGTLISTDFSPLVMQNTVYPNVEYRVCDAERIGQTFPPQSFDLVFSSSLFEHLPHPQAALAGVRSVLRDGGLTIHIMPTPFWKLAYLALYYPALAVTVLERLGTSAKPAVAAFENNQKSTTRRSRLARVLMPDPHGIERSHVREFGAFSKQRWVREFTQARFTVVSVLKGPVTSGHGFGWGAAARLFERLGCTSVYAYVAEKRGAPSPFTRYFTYLPNAISPN